MADKYAALATKLYRGNSDAAPLEEPPVVETFTEIASITSMSGPSFALDVKDVTSRDSTGGFEEVVPTIIRTGEISIGLVFDPDEGTHDATTGLVSDLVSGDLTNYKIVFPDTGATEWIVPAIVTGFETGEDFDGALTATAKLKISGAPTLE